ADTLQELIDEWTHLSLPLAARLITDANGGLAVEQDGPGAPAVLHWKLCKRRKHARMACFGKSFHGNHTDVMTSQAWREPPNEVPRTQDVIEIKGNVRADKWVIHARGAAPYEPELFVVDGLKPRGIILRPAS